jgi:hypothetical protein
VIATNSRGIGLVPVHIGRRVNGSRYGVQLAPGYPRAAPAASIVGRHPLTEVDWAQLGIEPRWVGGADAGVCAAAIDPSDQYGGGRHELERFVAGARRRGETALVLAFLASVEGTRAMYPDSPAVGIQLPGESGTVSGTRLPQDTGIELAPGLCAVDKDLALRVRGLPDVTFHALSRAGAKVLSARGNARTEPDGLFEPLLLDSLGDPVAAIWTPADGGQRWYILPQTTHLNRVIDWLMQLGLGRFVPDALVRARSYLADVPEWRTREEAAALDALARAEQAMARIEQELTQARALAAPMRDGLLFGSGRQLEDAVAAVLAAAGFTVANLDDEFGPKSADLLLTGFGRRVLVEVKSESGKAKENLVEDVRRHLATWPQLCPDDPVDGAVLVVNHERTKDPRTRSAEVYARPEFVAALDVPVLSSVQLFRWWRGHDWDSIRDALGEGL